MAKNLVSSNISFIVIFAEVTANECIIDMDTLVSYCEGWVQHIEMPFVPYDRVMLDALSLSLCSS